MIRRLITAIRDARIAHHSRRASFFGTATLAAQIDREWADAGRHMAAMHAAIAKRDRLIALQPRCCNHRCREGRDCPART